MKEVLITSKVVGRGGGNTPVRAGQGSQVDLSDYLLKEIWNEAWELRTDSNGQDFIFGKLPVVTQYGITMYASDSVDVGTIYDGIPIDGNTIYWDNGVLKAKGGTEGAITSVTKDMVISALGYTPYNASNPNGYITNSALNGYATQSWVKSLGYATTSDLDSRINALVNGAPAAYDTLKEIADVLAGNVDSIGDIVTTLGTKWTQDNAKIANWDTAYSWGNHASAGYALKSYVDSEFTKYVTLSGAQVITGEKNFTGGLKVNGSPIVYDSTNKYWKLEGDLLVTGGVTMYGDTNTSGGSAGATTLGGLSNVGSWADSVADVDRIMYQAAGSSMWVSKALSTIGGLNTTELQNYLTSNSYLNVTGGDNRYLKLSGGELNGSLSIGNNTTTSQLSLSVVRNKEMLSLLITGAKEGWLITNYEDGKSTALIQSESSGLLYKDTSDNYRYVLHSDNYSSYALPLSGGTFSFNAKATGSTTQPRIGLFDRSAGAFVLQLGTSNIFDIVDKDWSVILMRVNDSSLMYRGYPVYHAGNLTASSLGLGNVTNLAASGYLTALSSNTTNAVSITVGGTTKNITAATMKSSLGLGSNAYTSIAYLPLSGGTISGTSTEIFGIDRTNGSNAYVAFKNNGVNRGYLGVNPNGQPVFADSSGTGYTIWHVNNDGAGSGLDADLLDGQHGIWYRKNVIAFSRQAPTIYSQIDANVYTDGMLYNYGSTGYWKNAPTDMGYGQILTLRNYDYIALSGQLAWDINHASTTDTTRFLWWRATDQGDWVEAKWHQIAFTDSNVASATKLQTARTIWGQSFDGTSNIAGGYLSDVTRIIGSNNRGVFLQQHSVPTSLGSLGSAITFGSVYSSYGTALWGTGDGNGHIQVGRFDGSNVAYNLCLQELGGKVGIRTTNPTHTLSVEGSVTSVPALGYLKDSGFSVGYTGFFGIHLYTLTNGKGAIQCGREDGTATAYDLLLNPKGGNVIIGKDSSTYKLDVLNSVFADYDFHIYNSATLCSIFIGKAGLWYGSPLTTGSVVRFASGCKYDGGGGSDVFSVSAEGNVLSKGGMTMYSQRSLKNIQDERGLSLEEMSIIKPTRYRWKDNRDNRLHIGGIADDIQQVLPEVVYKTSEGVLTMDYGNAAFAIASSLIKPVIEHEKRIAMLEEENKELRNELERLKSA